MATFLFVEPQTFGIEVKTSVDAPFIPTEETVAIRKKAEEIRSQLKDFLDNKHEPSVRELMTLVDAYNRKANPEWAKQQVSAVDLEKSKEADKLTEEKPRKTWADTFKLKKKKKGK